MDYDLDSKDDFLDIRDDTYFDPDVNGQLGFRINPEDMEELGQIYLAKLKSLREQFNWENEVERYPFYLRLAKLMKDWKGNLPNLRDIFRAEEIDHLLLEAAMNRKRTRRNYRGRFFVEFVVRTGYKDNPELNEDGKPSSRRITAVHRVTGFESFPIIKYLFQIYNRFDVNYTDDSGYTHFHAACRIGDYDVIKEFLELGQDPNCLWTETGDSPLHLALVIHYYNIFTKDTIQLLLRSGADLNWANKEGSTPLHVICKNCGYVRLIKEFFEITDANQQTILIDAKDKLGRTSLQLSVASLFPDLVDVLLDRGADLSSFVFPTENYFGEQWQLVDKSDPWQNLSIFLVSTVLTVVERLEKRGYELVQSDASTIMKLFAKYELFNNSEDLKKYLDSDKDFVQKAKQFMFIPNLSFYDLIQLPHEEFEKVVTYKKLYELQRSLFSFFFYNTIERSQACATHLSEIIAKRFLRRWALEPLMELTRHYHLPILCCDVIIKKLKNQDLMNIFFAVTDQGEDLKKTDHSLTNKTLVQS